MPRNWTRRHRRTDRRTISDRLLPGAARSRGSGLTRAGVEWYLVALGLVLAAIVWVWVMSVA